MSEVNQEYLKNKNDEIFSPITSEKSVYTEDGISMSECLPLTYKFEQSSYASSFDCFAGNISSVSLIKMYGYIATNTATTGKAVYIKLNDALPSSQYLIDARFKNKTTEYYHRIQSSSAEIFIGDILYSRRNIIF